MPWDLLLLILLLLFPPAAGGGLLLILVLLVVVWIVSLGGTLYECGVALKSLGAASVSAFVAHSVFPNTSWRRYGASMHNPTTL